MPAPDYARCAFQQGEGRGGKRGGERRRREKEEKGEETRGGGERRGVTEGAEGKQGEGAKEGGEWGKEGKGLRWEGVAREGTLDRAHPLHKKSGAASTPSAQWRGTE